MAKNGAPIPDPNQPDWQTNVNLPPVDQNGPPTSAPNQSSAQKPPVEKQDINKGEYTRARIFLFISLPILILLFNTNTIVVSIITTMLILLSISNLFEPISNAILKYSDIVINPIFTPFEWIWKVLFLKHLVRLSGWLIVHRRSVIDTAAIIAIVILLGATTLKPWFATGFGNLNDSVCLNTHLPWPTCASGLGISTLPNGDVRIGLIANNAYGPFDQSTLNQNETKVEGLIFGENRQACAGQHITLIVVTMLSRTVDDATSTADHSLQELQGSYLAQHDYNATHPAVSICLAIANLGTANTANETGTLVQVIHQITQFAHTNPSLRGIVGFRNSQPAQEALNLIKGYQDLLTIPIISPSASSDSLSDSQNFYRIVSPDHGQGAALAQFFCDSLIQNQPSDSIAMLRDNASAYSSSLQLAFNDAVKCGDPRHRTTISYRNYNTLSIQQAVDQALEQHARYIFFPGYDTDMDTVELEIHKVLQDHASDITIIGGDGTNNVDATTHYSYNHIYNTTFAGPLSDTDPLAKSFVQRGFALPPSANAIPSHVWIPANTLLDYDAINAFAQVVKNVPNGDLAQDTFNNVLKNISFNAATGQVTFQGGIATGHRSDRNQGYIYITCNDLAHNTHLIAQYSTINNGSNDPPQKLSLSQADGVSACP
jgi:hypothetical protein